MSICYNSSASWFFRFSTSGSISLDSAIDLLYASDIFTSGWPALSPAECDPAILQYTHSGWWSTVQYSSSF